MSVTEEDLHKRYSKMEDEFYGCARRYGIVKSEKNHLSGRV